MRAALLFLIACDGAAPSNHDDAPIGDAPASELEVRLLEPNGGESLEAAVASTIRWAPLTGNATVKLELVDSANAVLPIAMDLPSPVGQAGSFAWEPAGVRAPAQFKVRITITDDGGAVATDESDATLTISPPATGISLARDLVPIFEAKCVGGACHNANVGASGLVLTQAKAHSFLVGVKSRFTACNTFDRVVPGAPTNSFLIFKLQGNGACFAGVRMPKGASALPAAQIQLMRDWISQGAKNN